METRLRTKTKKKEDDEDLEHQEGDEDQEELEDGECSEEASEEDDRDETDNGEDSPGEHAKENGAGIAHPKLAAPKKKASPLIVPTLGALCTSLHTSVKLIPRPRAGHCWPSCLGPSRHSEHSQHPRVLRVLGSRTLICRPPWACTTRRHRTLANDEFPKTPYRTHCLHRQARRRSAYTNDPPCLLTSAGDQAQAGRESGTQGEGRD